MQFERPVVIDNTVPTQSQSPTMNWQKDNQNKRLQAPQYKSQETKKVQDMLIVTDEALVDPTTNRIENQLVNELGLPFSSQTSFGRE